MLERVRGMDAGFLSLERGGNHLHVAQACVFDAAASVHSYSFDRVRNLVADRLDRLPPFRKRLVPAPLGLGHPAWIEDPDFDLDSHVYQVSVPSPGDLHALAEYSSAFISRRLERSRPLWEMAVVDGLEDGLVAGVTKVHHSTVDGAFGAELTANLLDLEPNPPTELRAGTDWVPDAPPTSRQQAAALVGDLVRWPLDMARTAGLVANTGLRVAVRNRLPGAVVPPSPFSAPRTEFDGAVGSERQVAFTRLDLADVTAVKERFGTKINDVVLAVCAGALRDLLESHGSLPGKDLVAAVPVAVKDRTGAPAGVNKLSVMLVGLATSIDDPIIRLAAIAEGSMAAKDQDRFMGPTTISEIAGLVTPLTGAVLGALASASGVLHRPRPLVNVVVSCYPGPAFPLYCAGAPLVAPYPMGPVIDGAAINITVQTYLDALHVGIVTSPRCGPDPWQLADGMSDALGQLAKAAA